MPQVKIRENEPLDFALRRFKRECERDGLPKEIKKREYYEKPSERKKKKMQAARRREVMRKKRELFEEKFEKFNK